MDKRFSPVNSHEQRAGNVCLQARYIIKGEKPVNEHERKIAVLLTSILQGNLTVTQLRRVVADGKAQVKNLGPGRASKTQLDSIAAGEEALTRIEREMPKYERLKNN